MLSSCTSGGRSQSTDKLRSNRGSSRLNRHQSQVDLLATASSISDNLDFTSGNSSSERSFRSLLSRNHHQQQSAIHHHHHQSSKCQKDQDLLNNRTTTTGGKSGVAHVDQNNNNIYQLNHQQQVQLSNEIERSFVNADGSIFTLANCNQQQALILPPDQSRGETNVVCHDHELTSRQLRCSSSPPPLLPRSKGTRNDQVPVSELSGQSEHQRQHRRLQYEPIHEQLQRIYGNKLQEFEQKQIQLNRQRQSTSKQSASTRKRQQGSIGRKQLIEHQQQQQQSSTMTKSRQQKQVRPANQQQQQQQQPHHHHHGLVYGNQLYQHHQLHHHHHPNQFQHQQPILYHEQTYDSLSPRPPPPPPPQLPPVNNNNNNSNSSSDNNRNGPNFRKQNHQVRRQDDHICAIPEEECDMNNNTIVASESNDEDEVLMSDELNEDDELEEQPEEEFLIPSSGNVVTQPRLNNSDGNKNTSSVVSTQKRHLESLHYATATAAALLNLTASAAAAFVTSEKRLNQRNRDRQQVKRQQQQQQSMAPQIYSDTYQDIAPRQQQQRTYCPPPGDHYKPIQASSYGQQQHAQNQMQNLQPNQYYLPASEVVAPGDQRHSRLAPQQQHQHRPQALGAIQQVNLMRGANVLQQAPLPRSMSFRVHEQFQQQQQQQQRSMRQAAYGQYQSQYCQARNMQQPPPPAPASSLASQRLAGGQYLEPPAQMHPNPSGQQMAINNAPLTAQQIDLLRRHRQLQQLSQFQNGQQLKRVQLTDVANNKRQQFIVPIAPAPLAILGASKGKQEAHTGLDMNLIARLTGANQQQQQLNQQQLIQMAHGFDPRQMMLAQSMFNVSKSGKSELAKLHGLPAMNPNNNSNSNKPQGQLTTYGLIVSNQDKHKQPQIQQIYAIGAPAQLAVPLPPPAKHRHHAQGVASGASSNASRHSNMPLILDRRIKSVSFVEKICQIDLTLLWWSLLTICVIFVATIVTISRYVF